MTKICIVHYSMYGHVAQMSEAVKKGIESAGATCDIYQVPETLADDVLTKMHAPPKGDYPVITADKLTEYDGIMFGCSGRYGSFPAQMKTFMDSTGSLWQKGALAGKPGGVFFSTGTQGGGQESIGMNVVQFFAHHGIVYVPLGYADPKVFSYEEAHGGSPYGAGCLAGPDGSRQPSDLEKAVAETQGKVFAGVAAKLAAPAEATC